MAALNNPHDRFFKRAFGQREVAGEFLQRFLPAAVVERLDFRCRTGHIAPSVTFLRHGHTSGFHAVIPPWTGGIQSQGGEGWAEHGGRMEH